MQYAQWNATGEELSYTALSNSQGQKASSTLATIVQQFHAGNERRL